MAPRNWRWNNLAPCSSPLTFVCCLPGVQGQDMKGGMSAMLAIMILLLAAVVAAQPTWAIEECPSPFTWKNVSSQGDFTLSSGQGKPQQQTSVQLCYTSTGFNIRLNAIDDNIQSSYTTCNDPVFDMDAMETFIAFGNPSPFAQRYYELDMSPYDVAFEASVYNPNGVCSGIQDTLMPCNSSGVVTASSPVKGGWVMTLSVPWDLWGITFDEAKASPWRMNFFRIDTPLNGTREYSCWSPTGMTPPCFHVPRAFGIITLQ